jgi:ABC-type transport system substrate-binding protein
VKEVLVFPRPAIDGLTVTISLLLGLALGVTGARLEAQRAPGDPTRGEVRLSAPPGWNASLVHDAGVGVWTVKSLPIYRRFACPEVVGLDDRGRCTILVSYSGKWTPVESVHDGGWLGAIAHLDLDPRRAGPELYTGGRRGRLYQVHPRPEGGLETRIVADYPGDEIHTLIGGSLGGPDAPPALLVFMRSGKIHRLSPERGPEAALRSTTFGALPGRVRDAVKIPRTGSEAASIATVTRAGQVALLRVTGDRLEIRVILSEPMGLGRLALAPARAGRTPVLYVTRDDGVVLRLECGPENAWRRDVIYAGPQGLRGVVAGRFSASPEAETVAVFGYSRKVQLLTRSPGEGWTARTIFTDTDKGHWLATAELDGRNATDEILGSGYSGRIFLLSRPPGFGLDGVATDPDRSGVEQEEEPASVRPAALRMAIQSRIIPLDRLTTLTYGGGFETKTLLFETLVRRDGAGRIVPGLASGWEIRDEGKTYVFTLRKGAVFHDGEPLTASAACQHFRRWVGLPEHGWLGASNQIRAYAPLSPAKIRIELDRPYALLPDLCAMNPCGIMGPGSRDRHGNFLRPVGTGPFRILGSDPSDGVLSYRRFRPDAEGEGSATDRVDLVCFPPGAPVDPIDALIQGDLDLMVDAWLTHIPRDRLAEIERSPDLRLVAGPGSTVVHLNFNLKRGPTADRSLRRRVRAAIARDELIREVEHGRADPCRSWAAPTVKVWPRSRIDDGSLADRSNRLARPLVLIVREGDDAEVRLARALAEQLGRARLPVALRTLGSAAYSKAMRGADHDLSLDRTWGVPYDPYISLTARFRRPAVAESAGSHKFSGVPPALADLVEEATRCPDHESRSRVYRKIQDLFDREVLLVPLYVPHRLAVVRRDLPAPRLQHDMYEVDLRPLTDGP